MAVKFSDQSARTIIEQVRWAKDQPRSHDAPDGQRAESMDVACFQLTSSLVKNAGEQEYRAVGEFVCWVSSNDSIYTAGEYTAMTFPDPVMIWYPLAPRAGDGSALSAPVLNAPTRVYAAYRGRWEIISIDPQSITIQYGQAQADWQEGGTRPADPYVSVKLCDDRHGTNVRGDPFNVYLPRVGDLDPQVYISHSASTPYSAYAGDVIMWQYDAQGTPVAVGSYLGQRVGTIDLWSGSLATMPYGWCLCDGSNGSPNLSGLFVRCLESSATLWVHGDVVGAASDGLGGTKRIGVSSSRSATTGTGTNAVTQLEDVESWAGAAHDGSTINDAVVCPPCYVLAYKYRWC